MATIPAAQQIMNRQRTWAATRRIPLNPANTDYTSSPDDNLFVPLSPATLANLSNGTGRPLGGNPAPICALRSSTALAINFFEYWRTSQPHILGAALGNPNASTVQFEVQYPKPRGIRGFPPNLDVVIRQPTVAFEAKFVEPYDAVSMPILPRAYVANPALWPNVLRLPRCGALAQQIVSGQVGFRRLNAAQLLKHIVGLTHNCGTNYRLVYLWYRQNSPEATQHEQEIQAFGAAVGGEIDFVSMTFQDLFTALKSSAGNSHAAYFNYLEDRYF
jgi:hypothetical protein